MGTIYSNDCAVYLKVKRFRKKDGSVREYLYIGKGMRVDGKPRQKVVAYLGRLDELREDGAIDSLVEGLCRYAERAQVDIQSPSRVTRNALRVFQGDEV